MDVAVQILLVALLPNLVLSAYVDVGIINGKEVKTHSRPYMVSVQKNGKHVCGGFLLSERFVMTAAHCWNLGEKLTAVLGAHDLSKGNPAPLHIAVKFYHVYPAYNTNVYSGDMMLLQLNETVKKSSSINWISIPKKKQDVKAKVCSVAGWGRQKDKAPHSPRLMEVDVSIMDKKQCQKLTPNVSGFICGHGGFCEGDSGGPLVCKNTAVGIVSFYYKTCSEPKVNVYTQISTRLPWINAILGSVV
ncbi:granzyme B-like [Brachyhypopomus gauderio]|uniref:granzyme B-like n=1 Tax=Brachyhypopomus gauderio TaxID=698409 RepID=UPI004043803F